MNARLWQLARVLQTVGIQSSPVPELPLIPDEPEVLRLWRRLASLRDFHVACANGLKGPRPPRHAFISELSIPERYLPTPAEDEKARQVELAEENAVIRKIDAWIESRSINSRGPSVEQLKEFMSEIRMSDEGTLRALITDWLDSCRGRESAEAQKGRLLSVGEAVHRLRQRLAAEAGRPLTSRTEYSVLRNFSTQTHEAMTLVESLKVKDDEERRADPALPNSSKRKAKRITEALVKLLSHPGDTSCATIVPEQD